MRDNDSDNARHGRSFRGHIMSRQDRRQAIVFAVISGLASTGVGITASLAVDGIVRIIAWLIAAGAFAILAGLAYGFARRSSGRGL